MPEGPAPIPADDPARDRGLPLPSAASVFSPWADLTLSGTTATTKADLDVAVTATGLRTAGPSASAQRTPRHRRSAPSSPIWPASRRCWSGSTEEIRRSTGWIEVADLRLVLGISVSLGPVNAPGSPSSRRVPVPSDRRSR
jgi:hypothetical protein